MKDNFKQGKWHELLNEFRIIFAGKNSFLDAILPPIIFLVLNSFISFQAAMWGALILSVFIAVFRPAYLAFIAIIGVIMFLGYFGHVGSWSQ